ncbi:MAG TPA: hypothetical protein VF970_11000 [Gemmatimonadales bacterium]
MDEHDLERVAQHLGERTASRIDADRVAARVLHRLHTEPVERRSLVGRWFAGTPMVVRLAAVLALVVSAGLVTRRATLDREPPIALVAPLLPELSMDELHEVLDSLALEAPLPEDLAVGLIDLTESELQELLKRMEG